MNARCCSKRICRWRFTVIRPRSRRCTARSTDPHIEMVPGTLPGSKDAVTDGETSRNRGTAWRCSTTASMGMRRSATTSCFRCSGARSIPTPCRRRQAQLYLQLLPAFGQLVRGARRRRSLLSQLPLDRFRGGSHPRSFVKISGLPLGVGALKRAEDGNGVILRVYEPNGTRGTARLKFARSMSLVQPVNLLEDSTGSPLVPGESVTLDFRPFEIKSLRLVPER